MKLNYKRTIFVGFAFFLICAFWQAYDSIVPMMLVNRFGLNQTWSGVVMSLDNIIALFMLPLFGSLSDKTKTKFGRRTPYVVLGTIVAVCSFFALTFFDNVQLSKINEKSGSEFYEELFEENSEIQNAEYSSIFNKEVPKKYFVKDYASLIVKGKPFSELTNSEQAEVKQWFTSINVEYMEDHSKSETYYFYQDGRYCMTVVDDSGDKPIYRMETLQGEVIDKIYLQNAYTNLITPARSNFAWKQTIANPIPFICFAGLLLLTLLAMATFRSPAVALMPDVTIKPLRSQANAVINLMGTVGGIIVLVLGMIFATGKTYNQMMSYTGFIGAICIVMVLGLLAFILKVREPVWAEEMEKDSIRLNVEKEETATVQTDKKLSHSEFVSLILILISVALWYIAYNAVTSKFSLYATNVLHMDYNTALLIAQGAAIVTYIPVGYLAQKIGRKRSILAGVVLLSLAFFGATFMNDRSPVVLLYVIFAFAGIGWATINVNSFPMVVELSSGGNVGKFTGYYYTASMAAQIVTPILSGFIMDLVGNMRPLFYYSTIFSALAILTMAFVKHGDNKPQGKEHILEHLDVDN